MLSTPHPREVGGGFHQLPLSGAVSPPWPPLVMHHPWYPGGCVKRVSLPSTELVTLVTVLVESPVPARREVMRCDKPSLNCHFLHFVQRELSRRFPVFSPLYIPNIHRLTVVVCAPSVQGFMPDKTGVSELVTYFWWTVSTHIHTSHLICVL